ncbi:MAG: hypothetical protein TREMPRED_005248, partial [Tremellales sp. Tagirdzhanova-0007]
MPTRISQWLNYSLNTHVRGGWGISDMKISNALGIVQFSSYIQSIPLLATTGSTGVKSSRRTGEFEIIPVDDAVDVWNLEPLSHAL